MDFLGSSCIMVAILESTTPNLGYSFFATTFALTHFRVLLRSRRLHDVDLAVWVLGSKKLRFFAPFLPSPRVEVVGVSGHGAQRPL